MADQGVRYVVTLQDINVTSGLKSMESSATRTEASIDSLNSALRGLAGAFGVGVGIHALIDFGKDAVQGAADYETAVKRIKFASADLMEGMQNVAFITSEADKFKIPLQAATEAYGKFLAMLAGSGIAGDQVRKLHDELLLIGKVKGLGDGQLDAAVMNLGKMLESGSLDARHFRPLEQQLSGIGAFVARELGITVHQLAILRNKGKMSQIDPKVLLTAIEKQAQSLEKFLPESTTTIQSQLNDLDNAWLKFKNDLVFDNIAELRSLFETLKSGITYLKENEQTIISVGKVVFALGEIWLGYKSAMLIANTAQSAYLKFTAAYLGETEAVVSSTELRAASMNALALATERVAYATELLAGASLSGNIGLGLSGVPLSGAGSRAAILGTEEAATIGIAAASSAATLTTVLTSSVPIVFGLITAGYFLNKLGDMAEDHARSKFNSNYSMVTDPTQNGGFRWVENNTSNSNAGNSHGAVLTAPNAGVRFDTDLEKSWGKFTPPKDKDPATNYKITPPIDRVTGQHVTNYYITVKEMNGIKENNVAPGSEFNPEKVGGIMADIMESILNDFQIRAGQ